MTRNSFGIWLLMSFAIGCGSDPTASPGAPDTDAPVNLPGWEIRVGGERDVLGNPEDVHVAEILASDLSSDMWGTKWYPCQDDGDCDSGYCLWTPMGSTCTIPCIEECPDGWVCKPLAEAWPDVIHICVPIFQYLCNPCHEDVDCNPPGVDTGARCVTIDAGGSFCAEPCEGGDECPEGSHCDLESINVTGDPLCLPDADCWCTPYAVEQALGTDCALENGYGTCDGERVCTDEGLSPCDAAVPAVEDCDGLDDDCDGQGLGSPRCPWVGSSSSLPAAWTGPWRRTARCSWGSVTTTCPRSPRSAIDGFAPRSPWR